MPIRVVDVFKVIDIRHNDRNFGPIALCELADIFEDVPQVLINCRVRSRVELSDIKGYAQLLKEKESQLNGEGRIFIRYSGTEPLIRILVEGPDKKKINIIAEELAKFLEKEIS